LETLRIFDENSQGSLRYARFRCPDRAWLTSWILKALSTSFHFTYSTACGSLWDYVAEYFTVSRTTPFYAFYSVTLSESPKVIANSLFFKQTHPRSECRRLLTSSYFSIRLQRDSRV
jgi:hypothetical protein